MKISQTHDTFLQRYAFTLSDDPARCDMDAIIGLLKHAEWMADETDDTIRRSLNHTHVYALFAPDGTLAGCVSVLSDQVFNARLSNLYVSADYRGRGLGRWMMSILLYSSRFRDVRQWQLIADEAQSLYRRFGFEVFHGDSEFMTLARGPQNNQN